MKKPEEYTVGEIIKCLEGDIVPTECVHGDDACEKRYKCFCYPLWFKLNKSMDDVLEHTTIQDLIDWKKNENTLGIEENE